MVIHDLDDLGVRKPPFGVRKPLANEGWYAVTGGMAGGVCAALLVAPRRSEKSRVNGVWSEQSWVPWGEVTERRGKPYGFPENDLQTGGVPGFSTWQCKKGGFLIELTNKKHPRNYDCAWEFHQPSVDQPHFQQLICCCLPIGYSQKKIWL